MAKMNLLNFVAAAISFTAPALAGIVEDVQRPKKAPVKAARPHAMGQAKVKIIHVRAPAATMKKNLPRLMM